MSRVTQSVRAIPPEKRKPKLIKTLLGCAVFAGGFLLPELGYPWQVGVAVAFFGGFVASQELIVAYAKIVPAAVGSLVRAMTGKNGETQ
jgi:hypothetical protein